MKTTNKILQKFLTEAQLWHWYK